MDALGLDGEHRLDIVRMQLVKLVQDGQVVRMSKRTGKAVSLTDLLDMVPVDACRYFFNAKPETQMEFDLGLAVREDSENPVYYVPVSYTHLDVYKRQPVKKVGLPPSSERKIVTKETHQGCLSFSITAFSELS